jgi:hypothetical protein
VDLAGKSWMNLPAEAMVKAKRQGFGMIQKKIINPQRVRSIDGGFSFIPHRFLSQGFLASLGQKELVLYLFLILAADRNGLSFYSYDRICSLLHLSVDEYVAARDSLINKDLIAFDGSLFQVLQLPSKPFPTTRLPARSTKQSPLPIARVIEQSLKGIRHE